MPPHSSLLADSLENTNCDDDSIHRQMKTSTRSNDMTPLPESFVPGEMDVVCSWARQNHLHSKSSEDRQWALVQRIVLVDVCPILSSNGHSQLFFILMHMPIGGNIRFRKLVEANALLYVEAQTKFEKTKAIADLIEKIRHDSPDGGFVKKDFYTGRWYEIGLERARDKVGHAIRKAADKLVEQKEDRKQKKGGKAKAAAKESQQHRTTESMNSSSPSQFSKSQTPTIGSMDPQSSTLAAIVPQANAHKAYPTSNPADENALQGTLNPPDLRHHFGLSHHISQSDSHGISHHTLSPLPQGSSNAGVPYHQIYELPGTSLRSPTASAVFDNNPPTAFIYQQQQFGGGMLPPRFEGIPSLQSSHGTASHGLSFSSNMQPPSAFVTGTRVNNYMDTSAAYHGWATLANSGTYGTGRDNGFYSGQMGSQPASRGYGEVQYQSEETYLRSNNPPPA